MYTINLSLMEILQIANALESQESWLIEKLRKAHEEKRTTDIEWNETNLKATRNALKKVNLTITDTI